MDKKVQVYIRRVREGVILTAARDILLKYAAECGGPVLLNKHLASLLLDCMGIVQRKATTVTSKYTVANFEANFLQHVVSTVVMEDIPPKLIMNWDQTGIKLVPCTQWTMEKLGTRCVELTGVKDKSQMTAIFCGTLTLIGDFLPFQLIYQGKTSHSHPHYRFPAG